MIVYFGCWLEAGHYFWGPGWRRSLRSDDIRRLRIPKAMCLDATPMFLPYPERVGEGVLTYLPGPDQTILAWWGSPFDDRGKVNSAVIIDGQKNIDELWSQFEIQFPDAEKCIKKPKLKESL